MWDNLDLKRFTRKPETAFFINLSHLNASVPMEKKVQFGRVIVLASATNKKSSCYSRLPDQVKSTTNSLRCHSPDL